MLGTRFLMDSGAVGTARHNPALASLVEGPSVRAQLVLHAGLPNRMGAQL